jgi:hypothetical protein
MLDDQRFSFINKQGNCVYPGLCTGHYFKIKNNLVWRLKFYRQNIIDAAQ